MSITARYLLDTNICIYLAKQQPPTILAKFATLQEGEAVISVITYGELFLGVTKSQHRVKNLHALQKLCGYIKPQPLPVQVGEHYAEIRAALEAKGQLIGGNDLWIAAHARSANLILVTNNQKEFARIAHLKMENWV